jgi:DnaJ-domain-containing protein 1
MLALILGAVVLLALVGSAKAFERASVSSIKALLAWIAALGGLTLALLLILTGRTSIALGALVMFGPLIFQEWQKRRGGVGSARRPLGSGGGRSRRGSMTREEALEILGLRPGASAAQVKEAHHRLMRAAHPDAGGSDWLAARINQARDVLIG